MSGKGGSRGQDQTITNVNEIDPDIKSAYLDLLGRASDLFFGQGAPAPFPAEGRVAPFAPQSTAAQGLLTGLVTGGAPFESLGIGQQAARSIAPPATTAATSILNKVPGIIGRAGDPISEDLVRRAQGATAGFFDPRFLDPNTNPDVMNFIRSASDAIAETGARSILPTIGRGATEAGQFGGSREGVITANYARDLGDTISRLTFETLADQYNKNVQAQLEAAGITPELTAALPRADLFAASAAQAATGAASTATGVVGQAQQLLGTGLGQAYQGAGVLDAVGKEIQLQTQAGIDAEISAYYEEVYGPFWALTQYAGILGGAPFGSTSTITQPGPSGPSPLLGAVGGAALGASLAGIAPIAAAFPGGAPALVAAGVLAGLLFS